MAVGIFSDGSNRELLRVELGETPATDPEKVREESEAKAQEMVDADSRWRSMRSLAETVLAEGRSHWAKVDQSRTDLKEERFAEWHQAETEAYAGDLRERNRTFEGLADGILTTFPGSAIETPVTAVDGINLSTRLQLMTESTPEQAARLVRDGIDRRDGSFLDSARILLESWPKYRNAWSGVDGRLLAHELLEEIEMATPDFDRLKGLYARERVEAHRIAWRYLLGQLFNGDGEVDPIHRQAGAFSPLLEPEG
jgi:hypothetical protein